MISPPFAPGDRRVPWLHLCPANWTYKPLKYFCDINTSTLPESTNPDLEFRYVDIGAVDSDGTWTASEPMRFKQAPSRARRIIVEGDVLISTVRTYLRAIAHVKSAKELLIASTGFAVLSARSSVDSAFLSYWVRSNHFVDEVVARSVGISYPAVNASEIGSLPFPLLALDQQRAIAAFLDREMSWVDTLIKRKQRQIELLEERRASLVAQLVVTGIDRAFPLQESGEQWLGAVPRHWKIRRTKVAFRQIDHRSTTGEEELLTVSHKTGVTRRSEKNVTMFMAESLEGYKKCRANDLIINTMWAWMGAMGIAWEEGIVSPSYNVYRFRTPEYEPEYYDLLFRTKQFIAEATRFSKGIWTSRLRLYPEEFFEIRIPIPPLLEQRAIVARVNQEVGHYDTLQRNIERSIEHLRERRRTVISAAVTGAIDMRVMAHEVTV